MKAFCDTPERREEIRQHWEDVRAGLHKPEEHQFGTDAKSAIAAHKFRAGLLVKQAAHHAKIAIDMATLEQNQ